MYFFLIASGRTPSLKGQQILQISAREWGTCFNFTNILQAAFWFEKCFAQLSYAYSLGLQFFGKRKLAQKQLVKCWWNWLQGTIDLWIVRRSNGPLKRSISSGKKVNLFLHLRHDIMTRIGELKMLGFGKLLKPGVNSIKEI